jgi:hypothetical protein
MSLFTGLIRIITPFARYTMLSAVAKGFSGKRSRASVVAVVAVVALVAYRDMQQESFVVPHWVLHLHRTDGRASYLFATPNPTSR